MVKKKRVGTVGAVCNGSIKRDTGYCNFICKYFVTDFKDGCYNCRYKSSESGGNWSDGEAGR